MTFHTVRQNPSKGSIPPGGKSPKVAITFEQALFERISGEAARRQIPFAEVVRERLTEAYRAAGKFDQQEAA